jgi:hypothetical protein
MRPGQRPRACWLLSDGAAARPVDRTIGAGFTEIIRQVGRHGRASGRSWHRGRRPALGGFVPSGEQPVARARSWPSCARAGHDPPKSQRCFPSVVWPVRRSGINGGSDPLGLPGPWQEPLELVRFGAPRDHALEHVGEPRQGLDPVQPRGRHQAGHDRPMAGPAIRPGEQMPYWAVPARWPRGTILATPPGPGEGRIGRP